MSKKEEKKLIGKNRIERMERERERINRGNRAKSK